MFGIRFIPDKTSYPFLAWRRTFFAISIGLIIASVALMGGRGLNFGIDFSGGILIEVETEQPADLKKMRALLGELDLGEVSMQEFGSVNHALIRVERQPGDGAAQQIAVAAVKESLSTYGSEITYRRTETVGPKVGGELIQAGVIAMIVAIALMLAYIWFRFELPFAIGAVIALVHDVVLTLGMLSLTGFEFNLASVAAVLLIVGYSMNDTVVIYDRVRENLRKYKTLPLLDLLNQSVNETLSRTVITSGTTLLALFALFIFGGEVIRGFSFTMIWGVVAGTYSSIFVAGALLFYVRPQRGPRADKADRFADAERLQAAAEADTTAVDGELAGLLADEGSAADEPKKDKQTTSTASRGQRSSSRRGRRNKKAKRKGR